KVGWKLLSSPEQGNFFLDQRNNREAFDGEQGSLQASQGALDRRRGLRNSHRYMRAVHISAAGVKVRGSKPNHRLLQSRPLALTGLDRGHASPLAVAQLFR